MLLQHPFVCNLTTASGISKRLFSYHPRLSSLILSKFSISPSPLFTNRSSQIHNLPSNSKPLQSMRPYIAPYRTVYPTKLPFERAPQHRNLIIQANSDNASDDDSDDEEEKKKLFGQMKDKSKMPDVVAHTAVVEAYAKAGKPKDALKVFMRMQASGCLPNSYSYSVLIQGLCQGGMLQEAGKYTLEMLSYGWKPNAATYVTLIDSYLRAQKADEMRQLLAKLKEKGFVADDKAARQHMKSMGRFNRGVMDMLFGQYK
uniref:Pentacotripeptide-repeat region of PRORP domain-containing protein n=1 Tax=Picea sitchensis TaxID=3332 RepID=A9NTV5_PICSI|nr:unknown [Picea sitchensis]